MAVLLGMFAMVHGDLYYWFACENKMAAIVGWIYPCKGEGLSTLIAVSSHHISARQPALSFPLVGETTEGWVALMPHLTRQLAPATIAADTHWSTSQKDYAKAGLYSKKELVEWRSKIMFPSYQEATLRSLTYGNCLADGQCEMDGSASIPLYNLDILAPGVDNLLGAWAKFKSWLKDWRDFLALCCILIFVFCCEADLCTVAAAAIKAGPTMAIMVGRQIYDYHQQLYITSVKQHLSENVGTEDSRRESAPMEEEILTAGIKAILYFYHSRR
ncbi:MAG: hypothetical protein GY696_21335 [Gammaproteobacteria bacterium]|nr:hypothetical protein [Gammaproteobacteria bacterium]